MNFRGRLVAITAIVLALSSAPALATAQAGDVLLVDGEALTIFSNPLERWLDDYPDRRPQSETEWSDLWRGYVATWAIEDGRLVLIDVEIPVVPSNPERPGRQWRSVMADLFPGQETVFASWYSGFLIQPRGELRKYVHRGYASIYKRYTIYTVDAGRVSDAKEMNSKQYRRFRDRYLLGQQAD